MTNEQRVRVDRLERYLIADRNKVYTNVRVNDLDTVLSLIKEQQEKIAKYEKIYKEYDYYRWVKELDKKDKQIDLMAGFIGQDMMCIRPEIECNKMTHDCKECIKQYFERKVEDVKD